MIEIAISEDERLIYKLKRAKTVTQEILDDVDELAEVLSILLEREKIWDFRHKNIELVYKTWQDPWTKNPVSCWFFRFKDKEIPVTMDSLNRKTYLDEIHRKFPLNHVNETEFLEFLKELPEFVEALDEEIWSRLKSRFSIRNEGH